MAWSSRIVILLAVTGCGDAVPSICDRPSTPEPVEYVDGCTNGEGVYLSAGWQGETCGDANGGLLHFPGGRHYRFVHNLNCPDPTIWTNWEVYLSFERDGITSGSISPSAGNQAQLTAMDENTITILNGSCVDYWMLIRVWCTPPP